MKAARLLTLLLFCLAGCVLADGAPDKPAQTRRGVGDAGRIKMASYNIRHGQGMDGKLDLARTAKVLRRFGADLIALQEVDETCTRSGRVDQAAELAKLLNMHHAFGDFMDYQGGRYGLAVLSRHAVTRTIRHQLPSGAEPRCALEIIVEPTGGASTLSFVCIHNDWTTEDRRVMQVRTLLSVLSERTHPVILAGDFNAGPTAESMLLLQSSGWSLMAKKGQQKTWPADTPTKELDHFMTRGLPPGGAACTVHDERVASDHRPISATFLFGGVANQ